jgi:hypothetical protein
MDEIDIFEGIEEAQGGENIAVQLSADVVDRIREYPLQTKLTAIAYRKAGISYGQIAKKLGVKAKSTIIEWCSDSRINDEICNIEAVELLKKKLIAKAYNVADFFVDEAQNEEKVRKASTLQLSTAACQLIDKGALMEGKTQNVFNVNLFSRQLATAESGIEEIESDVMDIDAQIAALG